eukprot:6551776-Heterocapsa_arctica.AAC.1
MTTAVQEAQFAKHVLSELNQVAHQRIYPASSADRAIVARKGVGRLKHLEIGELWPQDQMRGGQVE